MGLMYPFPISTDETDFAIRDEKSLVLKTYGLPYIFWIYALCSVAMIFVMFIAVKAPVLKLIELGDQTDSILGYSLLSFIGILPVFIFTFFFYEKRIVATPRSLKLEHRIFGLAFYTKQFQLEGTDNLDVESFLNSPNVARMKNNSSEQGFQNKGYFVLWLRHDSGKKVLIDRHSRKADLIKLKDLLESVVKPNA